MRVVGVWLTIAAFGALHAASPHRFVRDLTHTRPRQQSGASAALRALAVVIEALAVAAFVEADGVPSGPLVATAAAALVGSVFVPLVAARPRLAWALVGSSPLLALAAVVLGANVAS